MAIAILTFEGFNELDSLSRLESSTASSDRSGGRSSAAPADRRAMLRRPDACKARRVDGDAACTDLKTKPWVQEAGVQVLDQPFYASGNVATAGRCLASQYLAAWITARLERIEATESALRYVAPVGETEQYVTRAMDHVLGCLPKGSASPLRTARR